jgi:hypothetical protein
MRIKSATEDISTRSSTRFSPATGDDRERAGEAIAGERPTIGLALERSPTPGVRASPKKVDERLPIERWSVGEANDERKLRVDARPQAAKLSRRAPETFGGSS